MHGRLTRKADVWPDTPTETLYLDDNEELLLHGKAASEANAAVEMEVTGLSPNVFSLHQSPTTPPGKRRKVSVEDDSMNGGESNTFLVECKLGLMPEGQESLRKRKRYLA